MIASKANISSVPMIGTPFVDFVLLNRLCPPGVVGVFGDDPEVRGEAAEKLASCESFSPPGAPGET